MRTQIGWPDSVWGTPAAARRTAATAYASGDDPAPYSLREKYGQPVGYLRQED
jgi:hypothetical protein